MWEKEEGLASELNEEKVVEPPEEVGVFEDAPKETLGQVDPYYLEGIIFKVAFERKLEYGELFTKWQTHIRKN